ncbi:MAG: S8 family serine peptidase [Bacillota bacterium]|nr:S8 family serine peptidase [Bacillota bacterium]
MRKIFSVVMSLFIFCAFISPSKASDRVHYTKDDLNTMISDNQDAEYSGYVVKLSDDTVLPSSVESASGIGRLSSIYDNYYEAQDVTLLQELVDNNCVESIEPNYIYHLCSQSSKTNNWAYSAMNTSVAALKGLTGKGVKVGLVDSGVNLDDLNPDLVDRYTVIPNLAVNDSIKHGSIVADMIAGIHDNDIGVDGIAPDARIESIKCFYDGGSTTLAYVCEGIDKAVKLGCNVINLSLGSDKDSDFLSETITNAINSGAIVIAAAGNDGNASADYPAVYSNVIGVGAVNYDLSIAYYSQRNSTSKDGAQNTFVVAPGTAVYNGESGTSFASPCIAAAAAIMLQYDPSYNQYSFSSLLSSKAVDLGDSGYDEDYGYGFVRFDCLLDTYVSIAITAPPTKTSYHDGDTFDPEGMEVTASYILRPSEKITNYTVSPTVLSSKDENVTISYTEYGTTKDVKLPVSVYSIDSLSIAYDPGSNVIYTSNKLDSLKDYLSVSALYALPDQKESVNLSKENYTLSGTLSSGQNEITVTYRGFYDTFTVTAQAVTLDRIELTDEPLYTDYTVGESFNTEGLKLTAFFNDGNTKILNNSNYTVSP